jgi:hypothetical protein
MAEQGRHSIRRPRYSVGCEPAVRQDTMTTSKTVNAATERNEKANKLVLKDGAPYDWYLLVAMAGVAIAYRLAVGWHPFEDTFITFRYARNLSDGLGLVYNVGERVLGTTTPLYAVILAALHRILGTDFEVLGWLVNLVLEVLNVILLYLISGRYGLARFAQVGICAVYATAKFVVGVANSGMETPLFVAAILVIALAILAERWRITGVALAVAILVRPEGLIAAAIATILLALKYRSAIRPVVGYAAAICLPWIVVSTWYYGSPVPQSVAAKLAFTQPAFSGLVGVWWAVVTILPESGSSVPVFAINSLIAFIAIGAGAICVLRLSWKTWFIPFMLCGLASFYAVSNPLFFEWYIMPFVPLTTVLAAVALAKVFGTRIAGALLVVVAVWQGLAWMTAATPMFPDQDERVALYREAAHWLSMQGAEDSQIAATEIGVIGYSIPTAQILDTVGLVSPDATRYHLGRGVATLAEVDAGSTDFVLAKRPDFVISLDSLGMAYMENNPAFHARYHKVYERPTSVFHSKSLQIWQRDPN